MIFQPRRKLRATISLRHRNNIVTTTSLAVFIAEMLITIMITRGYGGNNICRLHRGSLIATTWAWIPYRLRNDQHHIRKYIPGGDNKVDGRRINSNLYPTTHSSGGCMVVNTPSRHNVSRSDRESSTWSIEVEKRKDSYDIVTETTNMAMSICGDDLSAKACSLFGGLKYYNTDIDNRFRVIFVLGGPGKYNRSCTMFR
jgi:hypothetical protein